MTKPQIKDNTKIELTMRQICQAWACSRPTANKRLAGIEPSRILGTSRYWLLQDAVKAFAAPAQAKPEEMSPGERVHLNQALLLEEKLKRMKAESVDAMEVEALFCDIFKRLADSIKAWDWLPIKSRRSICDQIRSEIERCNGEVEKCRFKVANPDA
jgi:hypothetical protein